MMIVDTALKARAVAGKPVRVGLAGAGFMGRGIVNQLANYSPGLRISAVFSREIDRAARACREAGLTDVRVAETTADLDDAIASGACGITSDARLLTAAESLDILVDATGAVPFGASFALESIRRGKDLILMNAEVDGTVGPLLKVHADRADVIVTGCDGDQPGVQLNLVRFVRGLGLRPLVCGNIKGLQDRYRTPTTQAGFAARWGQTPHMVTSFADGTKISFEQAIVANATGMCVARRGMLGLEHTGHVDELTGKFDVDELRALGGIVDYVVGAAPSPGVFVFAERQDDIQRVYLDYGKLGQGPLYSFYVPYHLTALEVPISVARVALYRDVIIAPDHGPRVDVVTAAKRDLRTGEELDGLGGYATYGLCENADVTHARRLLPIGVAEGGRLTRDVAKDEVLTYEDVELPAGRLIDELRDEQDRMFFGWSARIGQTDAAVAG
ncbi:MAG: NAD(P)-dependent oxidoreductase [Acidobacteria bacterium]|nr:NAD(P)-dependent oxidoreductase [Acidobacteriota bacterium]